MRNACWPGLEAFAVPYTHLYLTQAACHLNGATSVPLPLPVTRRSKSATPWPSSAPRASPARASSTSRVGIYKSVKGSLRAFKGIEGRCSLLRYLGWGCLWESRGRHFFDIGGGSLGSGGSLRVYGALSVGGSLRALGVGGTLGDPPPPPPDANSTASRPRRRFRFPICRPPPQIIIRTHGIITPPPPPFAEIAAPKKAPAAPHDALRRPFTYP